MLRLPALTSTQLGATSPDRGDGTRSGRVHGRPATTHRRVRALGPRLPWGRVWESRATSMRAEGKGAPSVAAIVYPAASEAQTLILQSGRRRPDPSQPARRSNILRFVDFSAEELD